MAKSSSSPLTLTFLLLFFIVALSSIQSEALGGGGKVGGRTKIPDVKTNKEVQELGKYCVQEYNNGLKKKQQQHHKKINGSSGAIVFSEVVEAEKQVVSGIKYYLKISATTASSGIPKTFDAVVVVKPWAHSRELLNFSPSPATK